MKLENRTDDRVLKTRLRTENRILKTIKRYALVIAVPLAVATGFWYFRGTKPASVPSSAPGRVSTPANYVDPATCATCHEEIARTYAMTGMGQSFSRLGPDGAVRKTIGPLPQSVSHEASARFYTLSERDGVFYQRRHQAGYGGHQTNDVELSADYVIGSGHHARTFLHRYADGRLVQLPVSWYAERGGSWAMSPGYDKPAHLDFRRLINEECMSCHNGYPRESLTDEGNGPRFAEPLAQGIDCQRCHGPGGAHVNAARANNVDAARRAIVNPKALGRDRELETCMQCHLEPTSSPLPFRIRRYDRGPFSYIPGESLADYFIYFDHAAGAGRDDKFEIASGAYRLRKSACFQQSQMTCTTCHDPHDIPRGDAAVARYVAVCATCHREVHRNGGPTAEKTANAASCITCHMPKRRAEDAVHVVMTDHFIQRRPPLGAVGPLKEAVESANAYRGEVVPYYPPAPRAAADDDLYLALAQVVEQSNLSAGIPRLERAIAAHQPAGPEFYFELARAYGRLSNDLQVIRWCEEAIRHDATFAPAFKELAGAATRMGKLDQAAGALETAVKLRPRDALALADLGNVYLQQNRVGDARRVLEQALARDPVMPIANNTMGLVAVRDGDGARAESFFRIAIREQPDLAEAHNNLGNVLAARKAYPEAAFHFEKAIQNDERYTAAHHSYGVVLALSGANDRAVRELRMALQLDPALMQARLDLGDVLAAMGRKDEAGREYEAAMRSPDPEIRRAAMAGLGALK